jgi:hypothetical protein
MLELYHNNLSVCAQKVRIVLAEKNVPWTSRYVSLVKGEQRTPEFKKMNPRGVVPVLVHIQRDLLIFGRGFSEPVAQSEARLISAEIFILTIVAQISAPCTQCRDPCGRASGASSP